MRFELDPRRIDRAFAAAGIDLRPGERFMNSLENRVILGEDARGRSWVAKFYRPGRWSYRQVAEEHRFLRELRRAGLPVAAPVEVDGGYARTVGRIGGILFGVFPALAGRIPDEVNWMIADAAGELLGRIHRVGDQREFRWRPRLTPEEWALAPLETLRQEAVIPADLMSDFCRAAEDLARKVRPLFADLETTRIHGDYHRANLLWGPGGASVVDFDDSVEGPPVHDVWMMVPSTDPDALALREALIEGYERVRDFDRNSLKLVEPLRALRSIRYAAWLGARRDDPAIRRYHPDAGGRDHWEEELGILQGLVKALRL